MLRSGLVSVTFRKLPPREIVDLSAKAGLEAIEWGGDVHCPPGQPGLAREVARMTREAGLQIGSYGSYYRLATEAQAPFEQVVETAVALEAPTIRVWAGSKGSDKGAPAYRDAVAGEASQLAELAGKAGLRVAFEFHGNTLTDTNESALALLRQANHQDLGIYWQPQNGRDREYCLQGLRTVLPWLVNIHAFTWRFEPRRRLALAEGRADWLEYLKAAGSTGRDHYVMLEFVRDDSPDAMLQDAATLRQWLGELP